MEKDSNLGSINVYFGKVVDVTDTDKLLRVRVSIDGLTNEIAKDDLPWYFPWYGVNYLPLENDVVSVIVFDSNMSTAFYGRKVDQDKSSISDDDYASYLEIYSRQVNGKQVDLKYSKTDGIIFSNDTSKIQIESDKLTLFVGTNSIFMDKDVIKLGDKNQQPSLLGNNTVEHLHAIITHQANTISAMMTIYQAIGAACVTPFTAPIGAAITSSMPSFQTSLNVENTKVDKQADTLQSKKVSNE